MVGLGILFGFVLVVAGLLISAGLLGHGNPVLLALGFLLMAACAIWGMQPGFLAPRSDDER